MIRTDRGGAGGFSGQGYRKIRSATAATAMEQLQEGEGQWQAQSCGYPWSHFGGATVVCTLGPQGPCLSPQNEAASHMPGMVSMWADLSCLHGLLSPSEVTIQQVLE